ncbi:ABC transporter substrate-binding protein [Spongisporangium articulatum]|uniref:Thiamine pyrimidine synthase n=1 Tax=Spongisporangium articulatum TaxID=3362603 RepID=A0ABW8AS46_9ACTN
MSAFRSSRTPSGLVVPAGAQLGRRRLLQAGAVAALGAPLLAACGSDSDSSPSASGGAADYGDLSVQLSWIKNIEFGGEYFAIENGYYKAGGFSSVNLIAGPTSAEGAVQSGKALVGLSAPPTTAAAIAEGATLKIIGATFQKNPFCIVSPAKSPIKTPQDMIGKKIGVQAANTSIFEGFLKANGIDKSKLKIVPVQFDPTVLTTGEVDGFTAYLTNEPITLAESGFKNETLSFADNGLPLVAETFTVLQSEIDDNREKLKAYLTAEIKGWKDALADPAKTADLAVNKYGKDQKLDLAEQQKEAEAQAKLIQTDDTKANGLFTMTDELVASNIEALGRSGQTITADKLFDLSLLKEIYEADKTLIG